MYFIVSYRENEKLQRQHFLRVFEIYSPPVLLLSGHEPMICCPRIKTSSSRSPISVDCSIPRYSTLCPVVSPPSTDPPPLPPHPYRSTNLNAPHPHPRLTTAPPQNHHSIEKLEPCFSKSKRSRILGMILSCSMG
jgi:hypothetical protein